MIPLIRGTLNSQGRKRGYQGLWGEGDEEVLFNGQFLFGMMEEF